MPNGLTPAAQRWLRELKEAYGYKNSHPVMVGKHFKEVLAFCEQQEIRLGRALNRRTFIIDISALSSIRDHCDFMLDFKLMDRPATAQWHADEKRAGIRPTDNQILVALTQGSLLASFVGQLYPALQMNLELDTRRLRLAPYSALVVVENRDSFYDWVRYQTPPELNNALVVYRGDKGHSRACKELRRRWRLEKKDYPMLYFGDLDPAGLRIALSGQYQALLLPALTQLNAQAIAEHSPWSQQKYMTNLLSSMPLGWLGLLEILKTGRGLRQQRMYEMPLRVFPANS